MSAAENVAAFGLEDPVDIAETEAAARREVAAGDAADVSFDEEPAAAPADINC